MPEHWTLTTIARAYGTKRRTLLEWCANGKWRDKARKALIDGREQWIVPDEVVQAEYQTAVIEAGDVLASPSPEELLRNVEGMLKGVSEVVSGMEAQVEDLKAQLATQEALLQEVVRRLPDPEAKRAGLVARVKTMLKWDSAG